MYKPFLAFSGIAGLALALSVANANPICGDDGIGNLHCDLVTGDGSDLARNGEAGHYSITPADTDAFLGGPAGWLEAWAFILDAGSDFASVADAGHIEGVAYFRGDGTGLDLWLADSVDFDLMVNNALSFDASNGQVVGDSTPTGTRQFNNPLAFGNAIGLANLDGNGIAQFLGIAWSDGVNGGSGDSITFEVNHPVPSTVPESSVLALMAIGAAMSRRKSAL